MPGNCRGSRLMSCGVRHGERVATSHDWAIVGDDSGAPLLRSITARAAVRHYFTPTKEPAMNPQQIASRLAELCRQGQFEAAQKELFADDAVSIEPEANEGFPKETKGLKAIINK